PVDLQAGGADRDRRRLKHTPPRQEPRMNASTQAEIQKLVSAEEWQLRVDLAACYRLVALYGWSDLIFTHITARVPGPEHHFLINPYGLMFDEITASSLEAVISSNIR